MTTRPSITAARPRTWSIDGDGFLRSPLLDGLGLVAGFTTRPHGTQGDSTTPLEVQRANRAALASRLGYPYVVRARQIHGTEVIRAEGELTSWPQADALWTDRGGLLLGITAA